jgi:hypothetical protein
MLSSIFLHAHMRTRTHTHTHIIYLTFWLYLVWTPAGNLDNVFFLSPIHIPEWDLDEAKIASFQISK